MVLQNSWSFPIKQEIGWITDMAFHGICHPFFIQIWLQQYHKRTIFHSAHCSLVWCWRTIITGMVSTSFAKLQKIRQCDLFRLLIGSKNFCKLICVLEKTGTTPFGDQMLGNDCKWMIVSRFTTFTENLVICCYQLTQNFLHETLRLLPGALLIFVLWQISQFLSWGKWE